METVVISDLHLGARHGTDLLREESVRKVLFESLKGADRLVLLGDVLELRHGSVQDVVAKSETFFRELGSFMAGGEVVIVPGNHDYRLVSTWCKRRRESDLEIGLSEEVDLDETEGLSKIANWLSAAQLTVNYPGLWLDDQVYAVHGHYLDCHYTVPTVERLAVGVATKFRSVEFKSVEDYESAVEPVYSLLADITDTFGDLVAPYTSGVSTKLWQRFNSGSDSEVTESKKSRSVLSSVLPLAVGALNATGIGEDLSSDLSGEALYESGVKAMKSVVNGLDIQAEWILFGHTHRSGPWDTDSQSLWRLAGGAKFLNTGSWVSQAQLGVSSGSNPYYPGVCVKHRSGKDPELVRLLES